MGSAGKELTVLDCEAWPVPKMHCPLVTFRGVFGCLPILHFFSSTIGMHLSMPANLYIPMKHGVIKVHYTMMADRQIMI